MVRPITVKPDGDVVVDDVNDADGKKGGGVSEDPICKSGNEKATQNKHIN